MIRRPPRSTQSRSSAASDVYKRQALPGDRGHRALFPDEERDAADHGRGVYEAECGGNAEESEPDRGADGVGAQLLRDARPSLPVSYTHLRAHETRHDLVCRL